MSGSDGSRGELRVVIVDDDPLVLAVTRRVLTRLGYAVAVFDDVHAALSEIGATRPFAVVADLYMPELSGSELLERVATLSPETRRLLYTGEGQASELERALKPGVAHAVVAKTAGAQLLPETLERLRRSPA